MAAYNAVVSDEIINKTKRALEQNGFAVTIADSGEVATQAVLKRLPKGVEVLTMTSRTLEMLGLDKLINESNDYNATRPQLNAMYGDPSKKLEQRKLGTAPEYAVGSVQALTQDGKVLVASATGSQLPAYTYGAEHVLWVVGAQKITKDIGEAAHRLETYVFPLENERAKTAYGSGSTIAKVVTFNREVQPGRIEIIIVKEALGF